MPCNIRRSGGPRYASYVVSAQYAEVAVKGRKRSKYERVLARNLRDALDGRFSFTVKQSRLHLRRRP